MNNTGPGYNAIRPVSVLEKHLTVDGKGLFKGLAKAIGHAAALKPGETIADVGEMIVAVGLTAEPGELAWLLVRRALTQAMFDLVQQNLNSLTGTTIKDADNFTEQADAAIASTNLTIDSQFFEHPNHLPVVELINKLFTQWLLQQGVSAAKSEEIAANLSKSFIYALNTEWRKHPAEYEPVKAVLPTPFLKAAELMQAWDHYFNRLKEQVERNLFDGTFSLQQTYIPLYGYSKRGKADSDKVEVEDKQVVFVAAELNKWIATASPRGRDSIRVLSGGPGSGKSSFMRMYAADNVSHLKLKVVYIPLQQLTWKKDLQDSIQGFMGRYRLVEDNPFAVRTYSDKPTRENRFLLLLDGLDELTIPGKTSMAAAEDLVNQLKDTVDACNTSSLYVQAIISCGEVVVPTIEKCLASEHIFYLLPYYLPEKEREKYYDPEKALAIDLRQEWWLKYGVVTGQSLSGMPAEIQKEDLDEITAQPLLNCLMALLYARRNPALSSGKIDRNALYRELLLDVYRREYDIDKHPKLRNISRDDFVKGLEEIGRAIWHGNGLLDRVSAIHEFRAATEISWLPECFQQGGTEAFTALLTAFFFRWDSENKAYEFTHRSFGRYLAARYLVRALQQMHEKYTQRQNDNRTGMNNSGLLKFWVELCGPASIDADLLRFLYDEVASHNKDVVDGWQRTLCTLISDVLKHGMPLETIDAVHRPSTYQAEAQHARNAEEALLMLLHACARVTEQKSVIKWPKNTSAGTWLCKLQGDYHFGDYRTDEGQRIGANVLALQCLDYLDLNGAFLHGKDLCGASLHDASLFEADCRLTAFVKANFSEANFSFSSLQDVSLQRADLSAADFHKATIQNTDFSEANLTDVTLTDARILNSIFHHADFKGANLAGANCMNVDFRWARNLTHEQIAGVTLEGDTLLPAYITDPRIP